MLRLILQIAQELKSNRKTPQIPNTTQMPHIMHPRAQPLEGRHLGMLFEKSSTRTRVSFEVAMVRLGGSALFLEAQSMQLARGESPADTARVLSRYLDALVIRTNAHTRLRAFADAATIPVINGLSNHEHPCQILADLQTIHERLPGPLRERVVSWFGDGNNNMARSWIAASVHFGFALRFACPRILAPPQDMLRRARERGARITLFQDPRQAADGADVCTTDVWVSMGDEAEAQTRIALCRDFQVTRTLLEQAKPEVVFLHCLPAHRGREVTSEVLDAPQAAVWDQAENRLWSQMAILLWCFGLVGTGRSCSPVVSALENGARQNKTPPNRGSSQTDTRAETGP